MSTRVTKSRRVIAAACAAVVVAGASGCSAAGNADGDQVTITIAGPNQWNSDPKSFGPAWEDMIERFEAAEPGITVKTTVLPISDFIQTLSTQLSAGTAPELVFNQAPHQPEQVVALDEYLEAPNPYVEGNERWLDLFDPTQFGPEATAVLNGAGSYEWVPFNLVTIGLYYNEEAFEKAGITAPLETFSDFVDACPALKKAGYDPLAMDSGFMGQGWTYSAILGMLLDKYADDWNVYAPDGEPGTSPQVSSKAMARAILEGELDPTTTPEIGEGLELMKEMFDECATPNWSGISSAGSFVGGDDFIAGEAAMAWGTNFAATSLEDVSWSYGTMPFPTIAEDDSDHSDGTPARYGASTGGTAYMIPSTTEGAKLDAAVKFLQFVTSPEGGQPWLDESGGISPLLDGAAAPGLEGLMSGDWYLSPRVVNVDLRPQANAGKTGNDGYLLGSRSLDETLSTMSKEWREARLEAAKTNGWTDDWVQP